MEYIKQILIKLNDIVSEPTAKLLVVSISILLLCLTVMLIVGIFKGLFSWLFGRKKKNKALENEVAHQPGATVNGPPGETGGVERSFLNSALIADAERVMSSLETLKSKKGPDVKEIPQSPFKKNPHIGYTSSMFDDVNYVLTDDDKADADTPDLRFTDSNSLRRTLMTTNYNIDTKETEKEELKRKFLRLLDQRTAVILEETEGIQLFEQLNSQYSQTVVNRKNENDTKLAEVDEAHAKLAEVVLRVKEAEAVIKEAKSTLPGYVEKTRQLADNYKQSVHSVTRELESEYAKVNGACEKVIGLQTSIEDLDKDIAELFKEIFTNEHDLEIEKFKKSILEGRIQHAEEEEAKAKARAEEELRAAIEARNKAVTDADVSSKRDNSSDKASQTSEGLCSNIHKENEENNSGDAADAPTTAEIMAQLQAEWARERAAKASFEAEKKQRAEEYAARKAELEANNKNGAN